MINFIELLNLFHCFHGSTYLKHDHTDLFHTLNYRLRSASDGDGTLCGVWEHVSCHLYLSTGWLGHTNTGKRDKNWGPALYSRVWCTANAELISDHIVLFLTICIVCFSVCIPLGFPWSCSHPSQWGSHTGWQAPQCVGSQGACW